jgi:hypothetical protein
MLVRASRVIGDHVMVEDSARMICGVLRGIDDHGALLVDGEDGDAARDRRRRRRSRTATRGRVTPTYNHRHVVFDITGVAILGGPDSHPRRGADPVRRLNGGLASKTAMELGGVAIACAIDRGGVRPGDVQHVAMGQVLQAGAADPGPAGGILAGLDKT